MGELINRILAAGGMAPVSKRIPAGLAYAVGARIVAKEPGCVGGMFINSRLMFTIEGHTGGARVDQSTHAVSVAGGEKIFGAFHAHGLRLTHPRESLSFSKTNCSANALVRG